MILRLKMFRSWQLAMMAIAFTIYQTVAFFISYYGIVGLLTDKEMQLASVGARALGVALVILVAFSGITISYIVLRACKEQRDWFLYVMVMLIASPLVALGALLVSLVVLRFAGVDMSDI